MLRALNADRTHGRTGFTLTELLIAAGVMSLILAVLGSVTIYMRKSVEATNHYLLETNNGHRMLDYVGRDLARALRVGQLVGATNTPFKTGANFAVTETNLLTVNLPDYYASNTPANTPASDFRTGRRARVKLGTTGSVPWADAVLTMNNVQVPRFAPASGSDEIQVRYYRGTRSASDKTVCYFRREYSAAGAALAPPVEIAEQVKVGTSMTALIVTGLNNGQLFRVQSNFIPRYTTLFRVQSNFIPRYRLANATAAGTLQLREVRVQNLRRD